MGTQTYFFPGIEEVHGATKCGVFNALMVRQVQLIGECWFLNVLFQLLPSSGIRTREQSLIAHR